jgi:hypothetical protein
LHQVKPNPVSGHHSAKKVIAAPELMDGANFKAMSEKH